VQQKGAESFLCVVAAYLLSVFGVAATKSVGQQIGECKAPHSSERY
jgi:hypothetical protein